MTGDPQWLTDAIKTADSVPDQKTAPFVSDAAWYIRAALPVIREGLAKEIEADAQSKLAQEPGATGWRYGIWRAANIVRGIR